MNFKQHQASITKFLEASVAGRLSLDEQVEFLRYHQAISAKDLASIVKFLAKEQQLEVKLPDAIDVCGTGGSGLPRINTSTISAFILAANGVKIAKHGNRATSGRFGSFDLLEALGINIEVEPTVSEQTYQEDNLAFLFARQYHSAMRHFTAARKALGKPSFFNLVGPLASPTQAKRQIIGTAFTEQIELLAEASRLLGKEKVLIVSGHDGLDEVTLTGPTFVCEATPDAIRAYSITPSDFGLKPVSFEEISGGNAKFNTEVALQILSGKCQTSHRDLVLVNAALALKLAGKVTDLKAGYQLALKTIKSGAALAKLETYKQKSQCPSILMEIVAHKKQEVTQRQADKPLSELKKDLEPSCRDFKAALTKNKKLSLIAEVKKASPSAGELATTKLSPSCLARLYENLGANAISVVTDQKYFQGNLNYLEAAAANTNKTPLLCKDFIIDPYQIYEARAHGADAILLIASILTIEQLTEFQELASKLQLDCLCEVHNSQDFEKALASGAEIIGINNRNLHDFSIDLQATNKLIEAIPADKIIVSESGFVSSEDLAILSPRVDAVLIGTSLVSAISIPAKFQELGFSTKKLIKICGAQTPADLQVCEDAAVDLIGFNFVPTSKRVITLEQARELETNLKTAGIFMDQSIDEVNEIAQQLDLDYVQLHGNETPEFVQQCCRPVIKRIQLEQVEAYQSICAMLLVDGPDPGSGQKLANSKLEKIDFPCLLAGGINPDYVPQNEYILGIDVASGSETDGHKDEAKIAKIQKILTSQS